MSFGKKDTQVLTQTHTSIAALRCQLRSKPSLSLIHCWVFITILLREKQRQEKVETEGLSINVSWCFTSI